LAIASGASRCRAYFKRVTAEIFPVAGDALAVFIYGVIELYLLHDH